MKLHLMGLQSSKRAFLWLLRLGVLCVFLAGCGISPQETKESHQAIKQLDSSDVITISFVGDNVLGDYFGSSGETFNHTFAQMKRDYGYFFANVREILVRDDMSLGNLEGPLTTHNDDRLIKPFAFKGEPSYTQILKEGSIEAVNIANNHTRDYGMQGFIDTQKHLKEAGITFSGEGIVAIYEIKGRKIGMAGQRGWNLAIKPQVKNDIDKLRAMGADIVIFSFHWGEERENYPNDTQRELGRFAIDNGADIVIGHHPHTLQGIEEYKGKKIVYSLGNFVYGGAKNPADKDTIIYQVRFAFGEYQGELANAKISGEYVNGVNAFVKGEHFSERHSFIPALISGEKSRNNYQPIIAEGEDKERVLKRMQTYSNFK